MIVTKAGIGLGVLAVVGAIGAWAEDFVTTAIQASGITIEAGTVWQIAATAVLVGIAFGVVRNKVDDIAKRFGAVEDKLDAVAAKVERFDEKLNHHASEIDRLREKGPRRSGRHAASDEEDV